MNAKAYDQLEARTRRCPITRLTVPPETKRMIIHQRHRRPRSRANMAQTHPSLGIGADGAEVQIVQGWLYGLVHCRSEAFFLRTVATGTLLAVQIPLMI